MTTPQKQSAWRRRRVSAALRIGAALLGVATCVAGTPPAMADEAEPSAAIAIEPPDASVAPTFWADIRPILERSCLACHRADSYESDVVLETVETILAYESDEPLIVPGAVDQGKLLRIASHQQEPVMPPEENEAEAPNLSPAELGLIQRWIELGAPAGEPQPTAAPAASWRPLPKEQSPVMAARLTPRGDAVVLASGNHLDVIDLIGDRQPIPLIDPTLAEHGEGFQDAAHLDMIRALAIRRDGQWIATGGYRTVKLWQHRHASRDLEAQLAGPVQCMTSANGMLAAGDALGNLALTATAENANQQPTQWKGHDAAIVAIAWSNDQQSLLSAGADGTIHRWTLGEIGSQKPIASWKVDVPPRASLLLTEQRFVAVADDLLLRSYELLGSEEGESPKPEDAASPPPKALTPTQTLRGHGRQITAVARVGSDAQLLLSGSDDGFLRLWDLETGEQKQQWIHGDAIRSVFATVDGTRFFSVDAEGTAKCWASESHEPLWEMPVDYRQAEALAWARESARLAAANLEVAQQKLADAKKQLATDQQKQASAQEKLTKAKQQLAEAIQKLEAAKAAQSARAKAAEAVAQLQKETGLLQEQLKKDLASSAQASERIDQLLTLAAQTRNPTSAEAPATDASAERSPLETAVEKLSSTLASLRETRQQQLEQLTAQLEALTQVADQSGKTAQAEKEAWEKQHQQLQKAHSEAEAAKREADDLVRRAMGGVEASVAVVAKADDDAKKAEATAAEDQAVVTTLVDQREQPRSIVAAGATAEGLVWLADRTGVVHVLNVDGRPRASFAPGGNQPIAAACAIADGQLAIVVGEGDNAHCQTWSLKGQWHLERTIGSPVDADSPLMGRVLALDFSSDGRRLAIGGGVAASEGQVVVWDLVEQKIERQFDRPHDDVVLGLQFSRDGTRLATAGADQLMKVFRVEDGQRLRTFEGHTHHVLDVAWRANGLQLATASADKTVKLWDYLTGEQLRSLPAAKEEMIGLSFLGTDSLLVAAAGDGVTRIYNVDDGKQARAITAGATYLFTADADAAGELILVGGAERFWRIYASSDGKPRYEATDQ